MASGYAAVENDGLYREPTCVKSIVDSDENVVYTSSLTEKTVYKQDAARMMTDIMTSVMDSGTGRSAKLADMPCAGKTGTTNDHKDGWFCGFTRYYTTAVWVGCDYPKAISNLSGSTYPAQIWKAYMSAAHEGLSSLDFLPYAQLSDDFKNQQKKEEEEHDKMREENQTEENQTDDQQTSESQQKDNTTDGSSENDNQPDNNDSNAGDQNNNSKPEHSGDNDSGESGGNTDTPENGENTNKPDNSGTTDNSGDTGESGDTGGGNVQ
jgi:penicillin-binding protein 1A